MIDPITQLILEKDSGHNQDVNRLEAMFDQFQKKIQNQNPCDKFWTALDELDMQAHKYVGGSSYNINWKDKKIPAELKKKHAALEKQANRCDDTIGKQADVKRKQMVNNFWRTVRYFGRKSAGTRAQGDRQRESSIA